jgi:hypothetical protein
MTGGKVIKDHSLVPTAHLAFVEYLVFLVGYYLGLMDGVLW